MPKKNIKQNPNKNTQLITVIGWYFFINGLTRTKYRAYEQALIKTNKFPRRELLPLDFCPYQIKIKAPIAPIANPKILRDVIVSFKISLLKISTNTGPEVMIIDASMGDVKLNP